jgi:ribosome maturation factor RimP
MGFFVYSGHKNDWSPLFVSVNIMKKIDPGLYEQLATLINSMGYELVGCEIVPQGRRMIFRIFIDSGQGVTLDDCSQVSHQVSAMMDVEDPIQGGYSLEISSPGIDRPLFEIGHYQKQIGKRVKIRLYAPINNKRQFKGILLRVEDEDITLLVDDSQQEVTLPFSAIEKANLIGDVRF